MVLIRFKTVPKSYGIRQYFDLLRERRKSGTLKHLRAKILRGTDLLIAMILHVCLSGAIPDVWGSQIEQNTVSGTSGDILGVDSSLRIAQISIVNKTR